MISAGYSFGALQLIALVGGFVCMVTAFVLDSDDREKLRRNRPIFWGLGCGFVLSIFLATLPAWKFGIEAAVGIGFIFILRAFRNTPFIKIRGRIYAAHWRDRQAESTGDDSASDHDPIPDSYDGSSPAAQTWWMLTGVYLVCMTLIYGDFIAHNVNFVGVPATIVILYTPLYGLFPIQSALIRS